MADRAHSTSRRALLAGLSATPLLTLPAVAAGYDFDPAMAALAHRIGRLDAIGNRLTARYLAATDAEHAIAGPMPAQPLYDPADGSHEAALMRYNAAMDARESRLAAAHLTHRSDLHLARARRAGRALFRACDALADLPATSLPALILKARAARHDKHRGRLHESIVWDLLTLDAART